MSVQDRVFVATSVLLVALSTTLGGTGYLDGRAKFGGLGGSGAPESVRASFEEGLDIVSREYAGSYEVDLANKFAIRGMLRTLDPHSSFFDSREFTELKNEQKSQFFGIGVTINRRNNRVYILSAIRGTPAEKAGLRYGDAILAVDGKPTDNANTDQILASVRGKMGEPVELTVERLGVPEPLTVRILRDAVPLPTIRNSFMVNSTVGYVALVSGFSSTTDAELARAISSLKAQGMEQIVLDMRFNPGGLLDEAIKVTQRFLPEGQRILVVRERDGGARDERVYESKNDSPESMPLVILINGGTASASEVVTGALQDHDRALVVGETSFGKGLVQSVMELDFGAGLTLTTAKYYTPTGRSIQRDYSRMSFYDYYTNRTSEEAAPAGEQGEALLTDSGRRVFGGGGITPDVKVAQPAASQLRLRLFNASFEFARQLVAGQVAGLSQYKVESVDFEHKLRGDEYPVTDEVVAAFRRFVASRGTFGVTDAQITAQIDYVRSRIREEVVTAAYGTEAGNQIAILGDVQAQKAIDSLPRARELAENARKLRDRN